MSAVEIEALIKPNEVVAILGVSRSWVYAAADHGILPHRRLSGPNGPLRFVPSEIAAFIEEARSGWQPGDKPKDTLSRVAP